MTRTSIKASLAFAIFAVAGFGATWGCKGEKVVQQDPQMEKDLDICRKNLEEKNKLVQALQNDAANKMMGSGSSGEIQIAFDDSKGCNLVVKPPKPGEYHPIDDKAAAEASKEFINLVQKSRGSIQKCYEQALKKNTGLQAKTVTLSVQASFASSGQYKAASFAPSLGDTFDNCMRTVASKWALPTNSPAMTFKASVSLTPS
jgi:hypothetical protein